MDKEFDKSKHPRDETGKFTEGVGTKAEQEKLEKLGIDMQEKQEKSNLTNEEKRLEELTGEKIEKELTDEEKKASYSSKLKEKITSLKPVTLKINGKSIIVEFDFETCKKNMHSKSKSTQAGFNYKKKNIDKWREIISKGVFMRDAKEEGKSGPRHNKTEHWYYFKAKHKDGDKNFNVLINIRKHKGGKYYVDELAFRKIYQEKKKPITKK